MRPYATGCTQTLMVNNPVNSLYFIDGFITALPPCHLHSFLSRLACRHIEPIIYLIFNVMIVIAANTIVTIQKRTVIFDSWKRLSGLVNITRHPLST